ncbi:alpha/beta hydrolase [Jannaschia marina]|uniref:alpha/beta hydrolase n=1 Tax=Jannaschia marina TaxID=2741674 RepID=UPI0015CBA5E9|nr:alpha/beta hydrolase [Jannaschia marina]
MTPLRIFAAFVLLAGCAPPSGISSVPLMEPPVLFEDGNIVTATPVDRAVPYATQREPGGSGIERAYVDVPSTILRAGFAEVAIGPRTDGPAAEPIVAIGDVAEVGPLTASRQPAADPQLFANAGPEIDRVFAARLDRQLAERSGEDIVIYVHGTRADFANPVLAAAELQHVSGYRNLFVAYAWPANTGLLTYFQDTEDSTNSAFQFRRFLRFLADETAARRIHIIAHSAGTRMVSEAIGVFALEHRNSTRAQIAQELRLGQVMLIGSDADPIRVGGYLIDGIDRVVDDLTIYASGRDCALRISNIVFGERNRLGQTTRGPLPPYVQRFIGSFDNVHLIDVTDAERSNFANGHGYLRGSPWVSSDILAAVTLGLGPAERGLVRVQGTVVRWSFPEDYAAQLRARAAPAL